MKLSELISGLEGLELRGEDLSVSRLTSDSRQAQADSLFVAVRGTASDGHDYLEQVAASGCRAVAVEAGVSAPDFPSIITATSTRPVPALLSRKLQGNPDLALLTAGVTGTNGKTTVAYLMRQMLGQLDGPCGQLGTISYEDGRESQPAPLTTPGGPVLYQWLARMVSNRCGSVAMEISSHALDQGRTAGLGLDVAVMTNLGRDHLDYHKDLDEYLQAKAGILDLLRPDGEGPRSRAGKLVINADDEELARIDTGHHQVLKFSARPGSAADADLQVTGAALGLNGSRLELMWQGRPLVLESPLVGRYNVENLTAALGAGLALGFAPRDCLDALAGMGQVPGRLERIALPSGGIAVVDYAHTHDALAAVLEACDELVENRLLVVFGCGGDRDRGKRPLMGKVAATGADLAWITSDNPRTEDPGAICAEIKTGYDSATQPRSQAVEIIVDRRLGIESALAASGQSDIVVIAGKGHEDYQIVGTERLDLDDRQIVQDWIAKQVSHG